MNWIFAAAVLLAVLVAMGMAEASGRESDREAAERNRVYHIREERLLPAPTPVPEVIPAPEDRPTAWARYDVPLDDDLQRYITDVCREYEIEPALVMAVIMRESGGNAALVGDDGHSYGLMQVYASQHTERCLRLNAVNLLEPRQNILVGVDYLAELRGHRHGMEWALSWYNGHGGEPCAYAYEVLTEAERLIESVQTVTEGR